MTIRKSPAEISNSAEGLKIVSPPSPWIGNWRRDLIDHVIVANERHLKRLMNEYVRYYDEDRTHLTLEKSTPAGRHGAKNPDAGSRVVSMPRLGGLHHRYDLAA
jgi:putative transposase